MHLGKAVEGQGRGRVEEGLAWQWSNERRCWRINARRRCTLPLRGEKKEEEEEEERRLSRTRARARASSGNKVVEINAGNPVNPGGSGCSSTLPPSSSSSSSSLSSWLSF